MRVIYLDDPPARIIGTLFRQLVELWVHPEPPPFHPDVADYECAIEIYLQFLLLTERRKEAVFLKASAVRLAELDHELFFALDKIKGNGIMQPIKRP